MKRKGLALLLTLVLMVSLLPTSAFARVEGEQITADRQEEQTEGSALNLYEELALIRDNMPQKAGETVTTADGITVSKLSGIDTQLKAQTDDSISAAVNAAYAPTEQVRVMVVLDGEALADTVGYDRAHLADASVAAASAAMEAGQDAVVGQIRQTVNSLFASEAVELNYHYTTLLNGVSVSMPYGALDAVRSLEGVASAFVVPTYSLPEDMTNSTADPAMSSTRYTFGSAETWDVGYTGEGMKIAIIDTGLDSDHPSFADDPSNPGMDQGDIDAVLTQLNAYERFGARSPVPLKSKNLYRSAKIAYGFNYVDNNLDITHDNDSQGDHGTHVAGITAANRVESTDVAGVAPDAQLLIMKVFGQSGGAYWDDILAALEDCILLDVDAVNMSLGSPAGFSVTDESTKEFNEWSDAVYAKVEQCDMILAIAAGNSYSAAYGTPLGGNVDLASNPDNGIISSPATYPSATVVASVENDSVMYNYITVNGQSVPYTDVASYGFISTLTEYGDTTYTYAMIDGYGTEEDFGEYNWENYYKIAVVSRGELAFTEKQANASAAGYRALIVYNNKDDGLMNMEDGGVLPNIFISKADGALMAAAADENGEGTLTVEEGMVRVTSETAGQMSDFSSWGVSPDLTLLPDVSAPGGNIYSSIDNGQYGLMSGTSMATPHIAGMSALVLEHLHRSYADNSDTWYRTAAEALIMSTAEPVTEPTGVLYSPRKQGAGAANVYSAVTSPAYLTVNGGTPKISLGDDDAKKGVYTFAFEINNMTASAVTYWLDGTALTDQVQFIDGTAYMGETSRRLDGAFSFTVSGISSDVYDYNGDGVFTMRDVLALLDDVNFERTVKDGYDLTGDGRVDTADAYALYKALRVASEDPESVTVPANGSVTVNVTLTLSDADRMYMDVNYVNGIYVDGFVRCYEIVGEDETQHDLSLPFLGFYGDWSAAPVLDDSGWDLYNDSPNRYWSVLWTDANYAYNLGTNPYLNEARDEAHNVLSPNGDGYQDAVCDLYLAMMRNAKKLTFTVRDEDGNVLHKTEDSYVRKSYYSSNYALCLPYLYNSYMDEPLYDFAGAKDGDRFTFTIEAWLDDGDDLVDDSVTIPIIIDCESPEVDADSFAFISHPDGGRQLAFNVSDNYDIAAIVTLTTAGSIIDTIPVNSKQSGQSGETATISLDVSAYDTQFVVAVCDYGFNESYYYVSFAGEHDVDENAFYGYRNMSVIPYSSYNYATTAYNGWYSFRDASSMLMHTDAYYTGETAVQAAEYVDGWVIGVDGNGDIFAMKAGSWERNVFAGMGDYPSAMDMAYDFTSNTMYLITDEEYDGSGAFLLTMNLLTGELTELGRISGFADYVVDYGYWSYTSIYGQALTLACDNDGVLYAINHADGDLYTIDPATCVATRVAATGYAPKYYQSMTVDHATNELYWAAYQGYSGTSAFYQVNKTTGELTDATSGGIQHNAELTALYKPNLNCDDLIPDEAALTGLSISTSGLMMAAGTQSVISVSAKPYYAELGDVVWTSNDKSVVTVENGVLTAVSEGVATVTASVGGQTAECVVTVIRVEADLVVYDAGDGMNWLSFAANAPQNAVDANGMDPYDASYNYFISAAYAHGSVYVFDYYGGFYRLDAETMQGTRLGVNSAVNGTSGIMLAMSYNYSDGYLYGIAQSVSGMDSSYHLVRINPANGQFVEVGEIDAYSYGTPANLAVDRNGRFYTIMSVMDYETYDDVSQIFTFTAEDVYDGYLMLEAGATLQNVVTSGSASASSLVWSEDNGCLLWANGYGQLLHIDPMTGVTLNLGAIGSTIGNESIMNTCLIELLANEPGAVEGVEITGLSMQQSLRLLAGSSIAVNVSVEPWNATASFSYAVSDTDIATVSENGVLTGVSVGETTLTVTEKSTGRTLTASVVVAPSTGKLYGMVVQDLSNGANYWAAIPDTDPLSIEPIKSFEATGFAPYAGAYYDGYLYAYCHAIVEMTSVDGFDYEFRYYLLKIDPVDYSFEILGNNRRVHESIMDMAFDYSTGTMYGVVNRPLSSSALVQIDLETAEIITIGYADDKLDLRTLTVDNNGQLYSVSTDGDLYKLDKLTGKTTLVGATGAANLNAYQSMHYDYATGNTYWTQYGSDGSNGLMLVDLESGASTNLGSVYGVGASVACLYTVPENLPALPETVQPTGVSLSEKQTVVVGNTLSLDARVLPVSVVGVDQTLSWSSDNEAVATVANGVVTGVSAGTAVITATAANGVSASCTVTVTAEARRFYAYDESNTQWISFTANDPSETRVERTDAEGESKILASLYHDGKLYSYTADGRFWSLDPDTFERTLISEDLVDMYTGVETTDWWGNTELNYHKLMPLSMAYDEEAGQAYVQMMAYELFDYGYDFYDFYGMVLLPIDLTTGKVDYTMETIYVMDYDTWESYEIEVKVITSTRYQTAEAFTNAVLIHDGVAVFVDTFTSGMVTSFDLNSGECVQTALINNYWGNAEHGRGICEDPFTGTTYIVRDMRDWGGPVTLNTIILSDADVTSLGTIGLEDSIVNSLFIR